MKKRSLLMGTILCCALLAGCGASKDDGGGSSGSANGITIFNSKMEIQDQLLQMAEKYEKETGVHVEVYYSSDTVSAHLATRYALRSARRVSMRIVVSLISNLL